MATGKKRGKNQDSKGDRTRKKILRMARKVFSQHPYHSASMRMIAAQADIDHPLIVYYFPNKAALFETIVKDICDEFTKSAAEWLEEILKMKVSEGFMTYVDRLLDFHHQNPEVLRILALNMTHTESVASIPGFPYFLQLIDVIVKFFRAKIAPAAPDRMIRIFMHNFIYQMISLLGASHSVAKIQGMKPGSAQYREWVRESLGFIFLPALRKIILPPAT